jgi:hypothetical protein
MLWVRLEIIPAKVIGKRQEERVNGKGSDELTKVTSRMRFRVCEPREIECSSVARG